MRNHMALGWFYSPSQIRHYIVTRVTSLKPPRTKLGNPIRILAELDKHQWLLFSVGFLGWTWDAFDFFTVSLTITEIAADFKVSNADVSWGITVTLMLRSVGALIFGTISDRYGRKYPFIAALVLFIILELGTGFTQNLTQFLAVRSLYGIAMGGLFGPAAATALEDLPYEARGLLSGLFEQGYAMGYLLAAVFYRALVPTTTHGWRSLFWFGACPPVLIIIYRLCLPETNYFQVLVAEREARMKIEHETAGSQTPIKAVGLKAYGRDGLKAARENWVLLVYMVILMAGFNACSHGSQDFYPTFLKNQVELGPTDVTVISVVGQIGALFGSTIIGYSSTFTGRRLAMMTACLFGGAMIPAYVLPRNMSLVASAFFQQFFVGGVWGPIPIYLMELSPPALRTVTVGTTYQLGNLASSASATIQAVIGERYPLPPLIVKGVATKRFDYGHVMAIFMGIIWAYQLFFLFWGPEMSENERMEFAEHADELERLRKSGKGMRQIGEERVRAEMQKVETNDSGSEGEKGEPARDIEEKV